MTKANVIFAGDFAPCRRFEALALRKKTGLLGQSFPLVRDADLSFVNLECPLTVSKKPIRKQGPTVSADPGCIDVLRPFSLIGLANNHAMDYGATGLTDSISAIKSIGRKSIGAGMNLAESQRIVVFERRGLKIAFIAIAEQEFNQAGEDFPGTAPLDPVDNFQQISEARNQADIVFLTLHGGNEFLPFPRPGLRKILRHYIELGVDAIVCHHPHVPGAYEIYQGKPIFYSLGNFIFDHSRPPEEWDEGFLVQFRLCASEKTIKRFELIPYSQSYEHGGVRLLEGSEKEVFIRKIEARKRSLEDPLQWNAIWEDYVERKSNSLIVQQYSPVIFRGLRILAEKTPLAKLLMPRRNLSAKLNLIRCQSHRELLVRALEKRTES